MRFMVGLHFPKAAKSHVGQNFIQKARCFETGEVLAACK